LLTLVKDELIERPLRVVLGQEQDLSVALGGSLAVPVAKRSFEEPLHERGIGLLLEESLGEDVVDLPAGVEPAVQVLAR